jgi:hypothetical protein
VTAIGLDALDDPEARDRDGAPRQPPPPQRRHRDQFKATFDCGAPVSTRGLVAAARFVFDAVLVYQPTLLLDHHAGRDLRIGLEPFLQAA